MICYIYKSLKKDELYLYIEHKDDFSKVPASLLQSFGKLSFVMEIELTPDRKLARENPEKVLSCLNEQGFFVQMPPILIAEQVNQAPKTLH